MPKLKKLQPLQHILADASLSPPQRVEMLRAVAADPSPDATALLQAILEGYGSHQAESVYEEKARQLAEVLKQIEGSSA